MFLYLKVVLIIHFLQNCPLVAYYLHLIRSTMGFHIEATPVQLNVINTLQQRYNVQFLLRLDPRGVD